MPLSCRLLLILLVGVLAGGTIGTVSARAAGDEKPKAKMKVVRAMPAVDLGLRPAVTVPPPSAYSLPPLGQPGAAFNSSGFVSGGLAQNGLRSSLPVMGDPGAQCRTVCTQSRIACDAQDAAPECSSRWAMCIAGCAP